ncbi:hypothetical protein PENSOL_c175G07003 [Penicillium solitum]|uniref:Uncharacterized protein n=1 Tax=Penicillium solitum TaxID=60172 RepID=A0A1V6PZW9_9EURO|nr:uncharacterized protein PENSOL_c175G07003 [Penicillium solitum]OQD82594.1 hypothetical protein PENSOL_c175G07003 [Penicillium solitum]
MAAQVTLRHLAFSMELIVQVGTLKLKIKTALNELLELSEVINGNRHELNVLKVNVCGTEDGSPVAIRTQLLSGTVSISAIRALHDGAEETITVSPKDIVIISLGSTTSGSSSGTNNDPPLKKTMEAENELDENWSIWLDLATQNPTFGDPYNFCTRISESRLESFTVTLKDPEFFTRFINLTHDRPGLGTFVSLRDSNWMISICIPRQPFFSSQPGNIKVFWGYGLRPDREGNFVRKPMLSCSGEEIMTELLSLLDFPLASILRNSITIPCVMPRRTASMLPRNRRNRPNVIPDGTANIAVIGQFVDIPDETTVSLDYSVRGAHR